MQWAHAGDGQSALMPPLIPPALLSGRILAAYVSVVHTVKRELWGQVFILPACLMRAACRVSRAWSSAFQPPPCSEAGHLALLQSCKHPLSHAGFCMAFVTTPWETFVPPIEVAD